MSLNNVENLIRTGVISEQDMEKNLFRVRFEDKDDVESYWLQVLNRGSLDDKDYWNPDLDEQVVCLLPYQGGADGYILGSCFNEQDGPLEDKSKENVRYLAFKDGSCILYDREEHRLELNMPEADITVKCRSFTVEAEEDSSVDCRGTLLAKAADTDLSAENAVTVSGRTYSQSVSGLSSIAAGNIQWGDSAGVVSLSSQSSTKFVLRGHQRIIGDLNVDNNTTVAGTVISGAVASTGAIYTSGGDVSAAGVSLRAHYHYAPGGGGATGAPAT